MKHILEKNNSSAYHLHVELDSEDLKKYIESAQKKLSESLNIKGFRKGHVPTNVVQDTVGIDRIRQEALQIAVADSLSRIVQEENIRLIRQEKFEIKENTPERLVYDMDLIIFPEIQLATYDNMDLKKRHLEVTDEEVRRVMGDVAKLRMTSRVVERPAQKGDRVTIDFEITEAGKEIEGGKEESYPLTIGDRQFIPEFEDQVIGITSGETKNFSIEVPADFPQHNLAGKKLDCVVTAHTVEELQLPMIDDQFAKSIGNFGSIRELESSIRQGLESEKERKEENRIHELVLKTIADRSVFEVPEYLIEEKLDAMIVSFDQDLHTRGMEIGLYLAHINKTQDDLKNEWRPKAIELVRMSLVAQAIAMKENIQIDEAEVEAEMQATLQEYLVRDPRYTPGSGLDNVNTDGLRERIVSSLMHKKVMAFLMDRIRVVDSDGTDDEDSRDSEDNEETK